MVIGIPTGYRPHKAADCVRAWKDAGVAVWVYTWDTATRQQVAPLADRVLTGPYTSFAVNHNRLAASGDWTMYICGADDLFPLNGINRLADWAENHPGKVFWVDDTLFNALPTHPVLTRAWYDRYQSIFDERFSHNWVDNDFKLRTEQQQELIRIPGSAVAFDHRHPLKTGEPFDPVYRRGVRTFSDDKHRFFEKWGAYGDT